MATFNTQGSVVGENFREKRRKAAGLLKPTARAAQVGNPLVGGTIELVKSFMPKQKKQGLLQQPVQKQPQVQTPPSVQQPIQQQNTIQAPVQPQVQQPMTQPVQPAPQIANAQSQTIEPMSAARAVYQAGGMSDWERAAANNAAKAAGMANYGRFGTYAEAPLVSGMQPEQLAANLIDRPDLVARGEANKGLYNEFANLYGTQSNIQLGAAQEASRRGLQGAETVFGGVLPKSIGLTETLYNPLAGTEGAPSVTDQVLRGANVNAFNEAYGRYSQLQPQIQSIKGVEGLVGNILGTTDINASNINQVNKAINSIRKNTSDPNYAQLQTLLKSLGSLYSGYLARSGSETETTRKVADSLIDGTAKAETIASVLGALKQEANIVEQSYFDQLQNLQTGLQTNTIPQTSQSQGGGYAEAW